MTPSDDHKTTFLFSVYAPPPVDFFQGYCFVGSDLVFGSRGAHEYQNHTGNSIDAGLDGCYVTVKRSRNAYIFNTDFAGFKALYYYHDGTIWAVSNSFAQLVDFLREHGLSVTPNYTHLAAISNRGMAGGQLFSLATIVREIHVVPPTYSLAVAPQRIFLERRAKHTPPYSDYESALTSHLDLWIGRFETLLTSDKADFTTDITGGVDSRANLALVIAAQRRLGTTAQPRLNCGSTPQNRTDLEVAQKLTGHYSLELNDFRDVQTYRLSAHESYSTFRDLSLGVYYPLYLPAKGPTPTDISISGGGGGVHRKVYENHQKSDDINLFITKYAQMSGRSEYQFEFERDAHNMLRLILEPGDDPLRTHLRDGRVRFHTGRAARFGVSFAPLHSVSAHAAQRLAGTERIEDGQFNYDIMNAIDPELVNMPYDDPSKLPTEAIKARLVYPSISNEAKPGTVWSGELKFQRNVTSSNADRVAALNEAYRSATDNPFVKAFWGEEILETADNLMSVMQDGGSIGNAANGKPIHAVLAADLVTPS